MIEYTFNRNDVVLDSVKERYGGETNEYEIVHV